MLDKPDNPVTLVLGKNPCGCVLTLEDYNTLSYTVDACQEHTVELKASKYQYFSVGFTTDKESSSINN